MSAKDPGRSHETRVVIDAPIEEVWKAITEARELARWFAPRMSVEPRVGGTVVADWGPGLEWKTTIEVWEPNRHLRLVETRDRTLTAAPVAETLEPRRLVQDFYLEAEGGKTVLRLVHSGFGSSADWDAEYEGTRGGWQVCFYRLRESLERHRGESAHNIHLNAVCYGIEAMAALRRMESAAPTPWQVELRTDLDRCGLLPDRNGSVFGFNIQPTSTGSVAYVEFLLFGQTDAEAARVEREWRGKLAELFPQPSS